MHILIVRQVKDEDEDDAEEEEDTQKNEDGAEPGMEQEANFELPSAESNLLTEFQYKFDSALRQPSRGLLVKDMMIMYDEDSVYGRRAAFHKALLVTASCQHTSW